MCTGQACAAEKVDELLTSDAISLGFLSFLRLSIGQQDLFQTKLTKKMLEGNCSLIL